MKRDFRYLGFSFLIFLFLSGPALAADYIVAGAPNANANGLYVQNGTSDGVPKYSKGDWELYRYTDPMSTAWYIDDLTTIPDREYVNWSSIANLPPNNGQWYPWSGDPVPIEGLTVTLAATESIPATGTWGVLTMLSLMTVIAIIVIRKSHLLKPDARA